MAHQTHSPSPLSHDSSTSPTITTATFASQPTGNLTRPESSTAPDVQTPLTPNPNHTYPIKTPTRCHCAHHVSDATRVREPYSHTDPSPPSSPSLSATRHPRHQKGPNPAAAPARPPAGRVRSAPAVEILSPSLCFTAPCLIAKRGDFETDCATTAGRLGGHGRRVGHQVRRDRPDRGRLVRLRREGGRGGERQGHEVGDREGLGWFVVEGGEEGQIYHKRGTHGDQKNIIRRRKKRQYVAAPCRAWVAQMTNSSLTPASWKRVSFKR